jgi:hypothetical protein
MAAAGAAPVIRELIRARSGAPRRDGERNRTDSTGTLTQVVGVPFLRLRTRTATAARLLAENGAKSAEADAHRHYADGRFRPFDGLVVSPLRKDPAELRRQLSPELGELGAELVLQPRLVGPRQEAGAEPVQADLLQFVGVKIKVIDQHLVLVV